jgi:hypothetical protein
LVLDSKIGIRIEGMKGTEFVSLPRLMERIYFGLLKREM